MRMWNSMLSLTIKANIKVLHSFLFLCYFLKHLDGDAPGGENEHKGEVYTSLHRNSNKQCNHGCDFDHSQLQTVVEMILSWFSYRQINTKPECFGSQMLF